MSGEWEFFTSARSKSPKRCWKSRGRPFFLASVASASVFVFPKPESVAAFTQLASLVIFPVATLWRKARIRDAIVRLPHRVEDADGWREAFLAY
ncbi:hypothetical protein EON81_02075 [bacterium]|nr:MAG: hypothetical protein EON81_02075 [bacterium]